ncbi:MAG: branched-chain amino acid transport system ATP-binding protein [Acidimicrobiaceae bacterium]|jgi:branched-chain amino acid transport system ATP-binding protein|nr:branched-chain amino acid transport system ATP-binding protein [Acidimicrobiaceae bacterium]
MPLLNLDAIHVRRGRASVLSGVSLTVEKGEIVTLMGGNGVGKSTTLRTISGLHPVVSGSITFDGQRIDGATPRQIVRLGISHVPEGRLVFPALTVVENLEMGAFTSGGLNKERLDAILDRLPVLRPLRKAAAGSLSGGQQQMLAIGRGIAARPKVLLLDEPSLGLSPVAVQAISKVIADLRNEGITVVLVEQNAGLALDVAERGYVMVDGEIVLSGTTAELQNDERVRRAYLGV